MPEGEHIVPDLAGQQQGEERDIGEWMYVYYYNVNFIYIYQELNLYKHICYVVTCIGHFI